MCAAADGATGFAVTHEPAGRTDAPALLDETEFATLMERLGPCERAPRLAIAVSGGADSMALALLAQHWVSARQGSLLALTVDHGLRPESRAEAETVGRWLSSRGIAHEILTWTGPKPGTGRQEAARAARYRLLLDRCRTGGILHLLLGHQLDDQAETVLLRLRAGSGPDGLAAMAEIAVSPYARLLRPLLSIPRSRLEATLAAAGQGWIEDPSNRNPAYQRVRLRQLMPRMAAAGLGAAQWAALAADAASARAALDVVAAGLLARAVTLSSAGYARVDGAALFDAPQAIGMRAFAHLLRTVGGASHTPRDDRLEHLWAEMRGNGPRRRRSLAGCLVAPRQGGFSVLREPAAVLDRIAVHGGQSIVWDGRFRLRLGEQGEGLIGPLEARGWREIKAQAPPQALPSTVLVTLPALIDWTGAVVQVPHLGWRRPGYQGPIVEESAFTPLSPLTGGLVWHGSGIMC